MVWVMSPRNFGIRLFKRAHDPSKPIKSWQNLSRREYVSIYKFDFGHKTKQADGTIKIEGRNVPPYYGDVYPGLEGENYFVVNTRLDTGEEQTLATSKSEHGALLAVKNYMHRTAHPAPPPIPQPQYQQQPPQYQQPR